MAIQLRSAAELEKMYRAGLVVHEVLNAVRAQVRPGLTTMDLERFAEEVIAKQPGKPAFKGYRGYPCVLCTSVNSEIVHGIPSPTRKLREGDIVSIDFGMEVEGYFGDSAVTVPVGKITKELQKLLDVTRESLDRAIDKMRPGNRLGDVGHALHPDAPEPLGLRDLHRDRDERLRLSFPPGSSLLGAADVGLVDLNQPAQSFAARAHHRLAVAVQHRPCRLIGAQPQRALQAQRRDAVLLAGHLPRRREPHRQRRARVVEDRPGRHRRLPSTVCALAPTASQQPAPLAVARRAAPPTAPPQPVKVVPARLIVREPSQQLPVGARIVPAHGRGHSPKST